MSHTVGYSVRGFTYDDFTYKGHPVKLVRLLYSAINDFAIERFGTAAYINRMPYGALRMYDVDLLRGSVSFVSRIPTLDRAFLAAVIVAIQDFEKGLPGEPDAKQYQNSMFLRALSNIAMRAGGEE